MPTIYDKMGGLEAFGAGMAQTLGGGLLEKLGTAISDKINPPNPQEQFRLDSGQTVGFDRGRGEYFIDGRRIKEDDLQKQLDLQKIAREGLDRSRKQKMEEDALSQATQDRALAAEDRALRNENTRSLMQTRETDQQWQEQDRARQQQQDQQSQDMKAEQRKRAAVVNRAYLQRVAEVAAKSGQQISPEHAQALADIADQYEPDEYAKTVGQYFLAAKQGSPELDSHLSAAAYQARTARIDERVKSYQDEASRITETMKKLEAGKKAFDDPDTDPATLNPDDAKLYRDDYYRVRNSTMRHQIGKYQTLIGLENRKKSLMNRPGMPRSLVEYDQQFAGGVPDASMIYQISQLAKEQFIAENGGQPTAADVDALEQMALELATELGWDVSDLMQAQPQ